MDMMKTGAGPSFSFSKPTALNLNMLLQHLTGCKTELSFVGIRRAFAFVSRSMQNKTKRRGRGASQFLGEGDAFSLAAVLLDHLLRNHSRANLVLDETCEVR